MAAMDSLDQRAPECAEIPRFDDGMVNIQELIRIMDVDHAVIESGNLGALGRPLI